MRLFGLNIGGGAPVKSGMDDDTPVSSIHGVSVEPRTVFQSTPLARRLWKRLHLHQRHYISLKGEASTGQTSVNCVIHHVRSVLRIFVDGLKTAGSVDTAEKSVNL